MRLIKLNLLLLVAAVVSVIGFLDQFAPTNNLDSGNENISAIANKTSENIVLAQVQISLGSQEINRQDIGSLVDILWFGDVHGEKKLMRLAENATIVELYQDSDGQLVGVTMKSEEAVAVRDGLTIGEIGVMLKDR